MGTETNKGYMTEQVLTIFYPIQALQPLIGCICWQPNRADFHFTSSSSFLECKRKKK